MNSLDETTAAYLKDHAESLARELGIANPPQIQAIRLVSLNEWATTQAQCLVEAGYDATVSSDGGVLYPKLDPSLWGSLDVAIYTCGVEYPTQYKYVAPLSQDALNDLYDYRTGDLVDCMNSMGFEPNVDPPSREVFVESGGQWSPFEGVVVGSPELQEACPQTPDGIYGQ